MCENIRNCFFGGEGVGAGAILILGGWFFVLGLGLESVSGSPTSHYSLSKLRQFLASESL